MNTTTTTTPVESSRVPNWLRLGWIRKRHGLPDVPRHWHPPTDGHGVGQEIGAWIERNHGGNYLDHWGTTKIGGRVCFVTEPYANLIDAVAALTPLADLLGCRMETGVSLHGFGTVRVILFPP
jgi:hypothetical protein